MYQEEELVRVKTTLNILIFFLQRDNVCGKTVKNSDYDHL